MKAAGAGTSQLEKEEERDMQVKDNQQLVGEVSHLFPWDARPTVAPSKDPHSQVLQRPLTDTKIEIATHDGQTD